MPSAIQVSEFGGSEQLKFNPITVGAPGAGQVHLKQVTCGLNFIDVYHRTGFYDIALPFIPGSEGAGTVVALGEGVTNVAVGDRVAYAGARGSYTEERLIAADQLVKLPDEISFEQASSMMLQGMTAQMLLRQVYEVKRGDTILVHAAAGGVGLIMCQWAAALGATVIGTVSTAEKAALAKAHGCHHPIIYTEQNFVEEVKKITNGHGVPVVYDSVGKTTFLDSLDCVEKRGLMVTFGQASGPIEPFSPLLLNTKGCLFLTRPTLFSYLDTREALEAASSELFEMVISGKIKININQTFALKDAAKAHDALESRATTGSTVLIV
ncbi:MAG: quinone oxidoreductase [Hyphomicrobiales bacterium]|nr:MAG: quinone oxidoreductase [Hyphomicrobiales bacterium]